MKLVKLAIDKLHGYYNYDVEFNSDVTFIYGENGCGKTTILNITAAIITGQLFKLFDYDFQQIELVYALAKNIDHQKSISIKPNEHGLAINFEGEKHILKKISMRDSEHSYEKRDVRTDDLRWFLLNSFDVEKLDYVRQVILAVA